MNDSNASESRKSDVESELDFSEDELAVYRRLKEGSLRSLESTNEKHNKKFK